MSSLSHALGLTALPVTRLGAASGARWVGETLQGPLCRPETPLEAPLDEADTAPWRVPLVRSRDERVPRPVLATFGVRAGDRVGGGVGGQGWGSGLGLGLGLE